MKKIILFLIFSVSSVQAFSQLEYYKGYRDGFKEGYCHGDVGCIAPAAPVAAVVPGEKFFTYKDGYNNGYAVGLKMKQSDQRDDYQQNYSRPSSNIISMYNQAAMQQFTNAVVQRQAIFDKNKEHAEDLMDWVNLLKTQSKDQQFLKALENYRSKLLSFKGQDLSTIGNELRQIERGIENELNQAFSRINSNTTSSLTTYPTIRDPNYKPGDFVTLTGGGPVRSAPYSSSKQIGESIMNQVVKIKRYVGNNFFEIELNGESAFISKGFIWEKTNERAYNESAKQFSQTFTENNSQTNQIIAENSDQKSVESIYSSALQDFQSGNYADARKKVELLISKDHNPIYYHFRGLTYMYEEVYNKASADFSEVLKLNPDDTVTYYLSGLSEYYTNDYKNALVHLTKFVKLAPEYLDAYYIRGRIKSKLGDKRGAISDYDVIISSLDKTTGKEGLASILNEKAYCLVEVGDYNNALPIINKALELEKDSWYYWDTRGELYYKIDKYQESISDMTRAISIEENDNSYYYRGLAKIMLKDLKGCQDLSKAGELGKMEAYDEIKKYCNK